MRHFTKNPNFEDGMTMRVPVPGTVPGDFIPFEYTIDPESRIKAGNELVNPFSPDTEVLVKRKRSIYYILHRMPWNQGEGDGNLYTSGLYPVKPRSLMSENAVKLKDGEIYHSITLGFGSMGAHGSQIRPDDRWKLVLYIRKLRKNQKEFKDTEEIKIRVMKEQIIVSRNFKINNLDFDAIGVGTFIFGLLSDPQITWANYLIVNYYFLSLAMGGVFFFVSEYFPVRMVICIQACF